MLTVLAISTTVIAVVLVLANWRVVREALLWANAGVLLLAVVAAVIVLILSVIYLRIELALVGVGLLILAGLCTAIEEWDRNIQFAKFRAWARKNWGHDE
jgi:hypothetical protein